MSLKDNSQLTNTLDGNYWTTAKKGPELSDHYTEAIKSQKMIHKKSKFINRTFFNALMGYFEEKKECHGYMSLKSIVFIEGHAQLKLWPARKTLIVKMIYLEKQYIGKKIFTNACELFLQTIPKTQIECIMMESTDDKLIPNMLNIGWEEQYPGSCNLELR